MPHIVVKGLRKQNRVLPLTYVFYTSTFSICQLVLWSASYSRKSEIWFFEGTQMFLRGYITLTSSAFIFWVKTRVFRSWPWNLLRMVHWTESLSQERDLSISCSFKQPNKYKYCIYNITIFGCSYTFLHTILPFSGSSWNDIYIIIVTSVICYILASFKLGVCIPFGWQNYMQKNVGVTKYCNIVHSKCAFDF